MIGKFITFEGIEGCGKTTQIEKFADYLRRKGHDVVLTREPGGTKIGDQIRSILLNAQNTEMSHTTELLLYAAARAQHVEQIIRPALGKGQFVISDRYADATTAYQGAARELPVNVLKELHVIATGNLHPHLTFLLDLPAEVGLHRARSRNQMAGREDRFENEEIAFHEKVRRGYLNILRKDPKRFIIIDASASIEEISSRIITEYEIRLKREPGCE